MRYNRYGECSADFEDPVHLTGYCRECGRFVTTKTVDFGVGTTEVHGVRSTHRDDREVCPVCYGPVEDCNLPCHAGCAHYDKPDNELTCNLALNAIGLKSTEQLDRGDECKHFESGDE